MKSNIKMIPASKNKPDFSSLFFILGVILLFVFGFYILKAMMLTSQFHNILIGNIPSVHLVPVWYISPFFAIMRCIPNSWGLFSIIYLILMLFLIPFLVSFEYKCKTTQFVFNITFWIFFQNLLFLGWLGQQPYEDPYVLINSFCTGIYFLTYTIITGINSLNDDLLVTTSPVTSKSKDLNYTWGLGIVSIISLIFQVLTGLFLLITYVQLIEIPFFNVNIQIQDFNTVFRFLHSFNAPLFCFLMMFHGLKHLYFGYFVTPKSSLWGSGILIFFLVIITAFMGYFLPWGHLSSQGALVILDLFSTIPGYGAVVVEWIESFSNPTSLYRFYTLHFFMTLVICYVVAVHLKLLSALRDPLNLETNNKYIHIGTITFFPYFFTKGLLVFFLFLMIFYLFYFVLPEALLLSDLYFKEDILMSPSRFVPKWYFLPFYAILRSIPNKIGGISAMLFAIIGVFFMPLIIPISYKSKKIQFLFNLTICTFIENFFFLFWLGLQPFVNPYTSLGVFSTALFFLILVIFLPLFYFFDTWSIIKK